MSPVSAIFTPDRPVRDPRSLIGRNESLRDVFVGYTTSDVSVPIVCGGPGIGKSSMLNMLRRGLVGYRDLPAGSGFQTLIDASVARIVLVVRCDRFMEDADSLSKAVVESFSQIQLNNRSAKSFELDNFEIESNVPLVRVQAGWKRSMPAATLSATDTLRNLCQSLLKQRMTDEIVILLDECEQLTWLDGLLDFVRLFQPEGVRFVLAMRDQAAMMLASARWGDYRWPIWVRLHGLSEDSVGNFYREAERRLSSLGLTWSVSDEVVSRIFHLSNGEPWYLQMIGQALLYDARTGVEFMTPDAATRVRISDFERAEAYVLEHRLHGLYSHRYSQLVHRAPRREELLRSLARCPDSLIPINFVKHIAKRRGTSARSVVESLLAGPQPVLFQVEEAEAYQFVDHQFRVFCRLSKPLNDGTDQFARMHVDSWAWGLK